MDYKIVRDAAKALNETEYALFKVDLKLKGKELESEFLSACESVTAENEDKLPDKITICYNSLSAKDNQLDITQFAMEARQKEKEMKAKGKEKKETVVKTADNMGEIVKKATKTKEKPKVETKAKEKPKAVAKPKEAKPKAEKPKAEKPKAEKPKVVTGEKKVSEDTKQFMAIDFVRKNPGATMYNLRQQPWNDKADSYYNKFNALIKEGKMRKEGKGYFLNE